MLSTLVNVVKHFILRLSSATRPLNRLDAAISSAEHVLCLTYYHNSECIVDHWLVTPASYLFCFLHICLLTLHYNEL